MFFFMIIQFNVSNNKVSVDPFKKYFLPIVKIENDNIEIDGRNFYDQSINVLTGQDDDYAIGCLLDFAYLKKICINCSWFE